MASKTFIPDSLTQLELSDLLGVTTRQVRNLEKKGLPVEEGPEGKRYPKRACQRWYVDFKQAEAISRVERATETDLEEWERRKAAADAKLAEIKVLKEEGKLIPTEIHERVIGEIADRLRAVLINLPANYAMRLEAVGVPAADAQSALDALSQDLIRSLRDETEALEDADDDEFGSDD